MTRRMMTDQESINLKLDLARHWLEQGHEELAKSIISSIIEEKQIS